MTDHSGSQYEVPPAHMLGRTPPPLPPPGWQQPPPRYQPPPRKRRKARWPRVLLALAVTAVAIIVIGTVIGAVFHVGSGGTTYRAVVEHTAVINPADLAVTIQVTNTGRNAGSPDCTVQASDASDAYTGINEGTLSGKVQPGQTVTSVMNLIITHQGAQYVTSATVSCQ
jgi:hypothetical protein